MAGEEPGNQVEQLLKGSNPHRVGFSFPPC
jgi:hypothetical protein